MENPKYLDFELCIKKVGDHYLAEVLHSPGGVAQFTFDKPFSDLELENFILRLGIPRRNIRRIGTHEMQLVRQMGGRLFESVFRNDVRSCFVSSQTIAEHQGLGLRVKLRLEAPDLVNIPWEFMYDPSLGRFLSLFENTPVVRYMDVREPVQPLVMQPPLSILVMISNPSDYPELDVAHERQNLEDALGELVQQGLIRLTWMDTAILPALAEALLRDQYHIFHFIGHGGYDEQSQDGVLIFENGYGLGKLVSGERLAVLLGNQPDLRLVTLNACEGARASQEEPFSGTAMTLIRTGGVPAVVAMQFAITDLAATTFARGFYTALSVGRPVDAAVTQARLAIFATGNDFEWGTPVLYMRSPDGNIFDIAAVRTRTIKPSPVEVEVMTEEVQKLRQLADLFAGALADLEAMRWKEAIQALQTILQLEPNYRDPVHGTAADFLRQARQKKEQMELPPPPATGRPGTLPED